MRQHFALLMIVALITAFGVFSANRASHAQDNGPRGPASMEIPIAATK